MRMESGPHPGPAGAMRKLCTQEEGPLENHAVPFSAAFAASWPGRERLHVTILFLQGRSQVPRDEKHQVGIRSLFASMGAHPYWSGVLRGRTKNLKASYLVSPFQPACTHPPFLSPLISGQRSDRNPRKQATALPSSHPFDAVPLPPAPPPRHHTHCLCSSAHSTGVQEGSAMCQAWVHRISLQAGGEKASNHTATQMSI